MGVWGKKRGGSSVGCADKLPLTPEPRSLPQNIEVEKWCFLFLGCFVRVCLVGRRCLAFVGLLGDRRDERCWSGCLEGVWAAVKAYACLLRGHDSWLLPGDLLWWTSLGCSCIGVWTWWRNKFLNLLYLFFLKSVNTRIVNEIHVFHLSDVMR